MNKPYSFPYGKTTQTASLPEICIQAVIEYDLSSYRPPLGPEETVKYALANPHDITELSVLAKGCKTVTVITSDHTRPMLSQITMPLLLQEIRKGNPDAQITILIAEGFIEPHFFAGFSGGRKSILPGVASRKPLCTIMRPAIFMILIPSQAFWKEILFMKICSLLPKLLESALS